MDSALQQYLRLVNSGEAKPFRVLTQELAAYWQVLEPTFEWTAEQRQRAGYAFLRDEVFPRRTSMLAIADPTGQPAHHCLYWQLECRQPALLPACRLSRDLGVRLGELKPQDPFPGARAFVGVEFPLPGRLESEPAKVGRESSLQFRLRYFSLWIYADSDNHRWFALNGIASLFGNIREDAARDPIFDYQLVAGGLRLLIRTVWRNVLRRGRRRGRNGRRSRRWSMRPPHHYTTYDRYTGDYQAGRSGYTPESVPCR